MHVSNGVLHSTGGRRDNCEPRTVVNLQTTFSSFFWSIDGKLKTCVDKRFVIERLLWLAFLPNPKTALWTAHALSQTSLSVYKLLTCACVVCISSLLLVFFTLSPILPRVMVYLKLIEKPLTCLSGRVGVYPTGNQTPLHFFFCCSAIANVLSVSPCCEAYRYLFVAVSSICAAPGC